jgi:signal transduction histidine kinase
MLVVRGAESQDVFAAFTAEIGPVLAVPFVSVVRYDGEGAVIVGSWSESGKPYPIQVGDRRPLDEVHVATLVFRTGPATRIDDFRTVSGEWADRARDWGLGSAVAVPIAVAARLWGCVVVGALEGESLPSDTEAQLASFTELAAMAIANAEATEALTASRARIIAAADEGRRQIERDLHDGAQQGLVSLALYLQAVRASVPADADALAGQSDRAVMMLTVVLDELSEIAHGVHPTVLSQGGLRPALKGLARRSAVPVQLDIRAERRLPEHVELCAYYVIAEALTNTAKHAAASEVHVNVVADDEVLRIEVRDNGRGGASIEGGSGIVGLRDRVDALGGSLVRDSPPGSGTTLAMSLPLNG